MGITKNDVFTNLALLLSDQCLHTTKTAVFNDESCTEFRDSKEFGGPIFKLYENCPVQPSIEATANAFRIVLPNMNTCAGAAEHTPEVTEKAPVTVTPQMKTVLDHLSEYGEMTDEDLQELLNVKKTRAYLLARQMHENGLIEIVGRGVGKKYKLK